MVIGSLVSGRRRKERIVEESRARWLLGRGHCGRGQGQMLVVFEVVEFGTGRWKDEKMVDGEEMAEAEAYGEKYSVSSSSEKVRKWYTVQPMLDIEKDIWRNEHPKASRKPSPEFGRIGLIFLKYVSLS